MARAAELEVDTLVSACPWSERPLSAAGEEQGIAVVDLFELVAEAAGIEVGGRTGADRACWGADGVAVQPPWHEGAR